MVDDSNRKLIENLDEEKLLEMVREEGSLADGANRQRVEKKLLDDLGLFDINLNKFDLSDDLENRIRRLKYINMESREQRELPKEKQREVRERMRELGFEPSDGD